MRDLDAGREATLLADRSFKIGGVVFKVRPFVPVDLKVALDTVLFRIDPRPSAEELVKAADDFITAMLEPGQEEAWAAVRSKDAELPLAENDLDAIIRHIDEVTAGRPTGQPSDSGTSPSTIGTESKDASPSQEETSAV